MIKPALLPTVTVLIPSKDSGATIDLCLQSLFNLDYPQTLVEVIVIDSSNPPLKLRAELESRLKLITVECSAPAAYNIALPYASGAVIAFIDADAIADRSWLRSLVQPLLESDAAAVGGNIRTGN